MKGCRIQCEFQIGKKKKVLTNREASGVDDPLPVKAEKLIGFKLGYEPVIKCASETYRMIN